jgi:large subunit ribosomal protein L3
MYGLGKKIGMTRLFVDGVHTPVTVIEFGEQKVIQKKTQDKDGYNAIQVGIGSKKKSSKAAKGHAKKHADNDTAFGKIVEFKNVELAEDKNSFDINDITTETVFHVTANTIGRGFTGVIKRHGFHGQPQSHGHDHVRAVGSIGARWPQRVLPGKKMAGHHGAQQRTIRNVPVVAVDPELKLIFVKGSIPGANNSLVKLTSTTK